MKPMRLMDRPEDYSRLNVQPQKVAPWEDGRRCGFRQIVNARIGAS